MCIPKLMVGWLVFILSGSTWITRPLLARAAPILAVEEKDEVVKVGAPFSYYIDNSGSLTIEDVAASSELGWLVSESEDIKTKTDSHQKVFARVILDSKVSGNYTLAHDFTFDPLTRFRMILVNADGAVVKESFFKPKPTFEIGLKPGINTIIIEVSNSTYEATKIRYQLLKSTDFAVQHFWRGNFYGVIFGIAIAMCVYNMSMFYFFRNLYFLYYCPYVLGFATILAYGAGSIPHPDMNLFWRLPIIISGIFLFLFKSSALNLKTYTPKLYKVFLALTLLHVAGVTWSMFSTSGGMAIFFAPFLITVAIACAFVRTKQGYKPAAFFVYGWSLFFIGFIVGFIQLLFPVDYAFHFSGFIGFSLEIILFSFATSYKARLQEKKMNQENEHAFRQLQKVFYPHQISQIKKAAELESTMPTHPGVACVICFDIIASSTIQHEKTKDFFRNVFRRCNEIMMSGYDPDTMTANAYRIKEMGDGFLCSIGYPFKSKTGFMAKDALDVATLFHDAFQEEVEKFGYREPIYCSIGIALDHITGFYPETGAKEYDLYGKSIVLATRYEGMRKVIFSRINASVLILQARVFLSLDEQEANTFTEYNLHDEGLVVRDDPAAKRLYFKHLPETRASRERSTLVKAYDSAG
ncbi:7TM-DISM domain-containing protein [Oligoflexus tunisiensis]|uniref:7TM-DISM domain-containing protein n=1 Tax=Oligoflexus tunisiensis TaxID=708132 RepID=UPI00114CD342|nr:7TM-DISM domain-containing protein [Oligoflexus tunisiensis]